MFSKTYYLQGVLSSDKYLNVKWSDANVVFSLTRQGNALNCHFSSDKASLRKVKQAINEFCEWAFSLFKWCKMIVAIVVLPSVGRMIKKCGFEFLTPDGDNSVYMRSR